MAFGLRGGYTLKYIYQVDPGKYIIKMYSTIGSHSIGTYYEGRGGRGSSHRGSRTRGRDGGPVPRRGRPPSHSLG